MQADGRAAYDAVHGDRPGCLKLEQIAVVYPGKRRYPLGKRVAAVPLEAVADGMKGLFPKKERV
jgi:hypothetical protein